MKKKLNEKMLGEATKSLSHYVTALIILGLISAIISFVLILSTGWSDWSIYFALSPIWCFMLFWKTRDWLVLIQSHDIEEVVNDLSRLRAKALGFVLSGLVLGMLFILHPLPIKPLAVYLALNGALFLVICLKTQWELGTISDKLNAS